jgi:hypothetical protein
MTRLKTHDRQTEHGIKDRRADPKPPEKSATAQHTHPIWMHPWIPRPRASWWGKTLPARRRPIEVWRGPASRREGRRERRPAAESAVLGRERGSCVVILDGRLMG